MKIDITSYFIIINKTVWLFDKLITAFYDILRPFLIFTYLKIYCMVSENLSLNNQAEITWFSWEIVAFDGHRNTPASAAGV